MDFEQVTRTPNAQGFTLSYRGSKVHVREVARAAFDISYHNIAYGVFAAEVQAELAPRLREGHKISLCVDASALSSYESEFRRLWSKWFSEHRGRYYQVPILFRSPLVRMGINVVNPLIGNMILALSDRAAYEQAVQASVARAAQSSLSAQL